MEIPPNFWNERYGTEDFAYGTAPNGFVVEQAGRIPAGRVVCVGAGEGRNAAHLAGLGYSVVAVDGSKTGAVKTKRLAAERGVEVETVTADLRDHDLGDQVWQGAVAIFCHLPSELRRLVHRGIVRSLASGGVLLFESYTPAQLGRGTGGPPVRDMLCSLDDARREFEGLDFEIAHELERDVNEGRYHTGTAAVVQLVGVKPPARGH